MGLFDFLKKQMLEVIEWEDSSKDIIVYRYPLKDREEIMNSSTLIVRPSQVALFIYKGEIADIFAPGTYKLSSENIPVITKMLSLPTNFNSPIKAEIYFVNTKQFTKNKWGTQNPIIMRDADFGNVRVRGYGAYAFKVNDAKTFMKEIFGTNNCYLVTEIEEYLRPIILQGLTDYIAESKISVLDLASNYKEFSDNVKLSLEKEFEKIGLKLTNIIIENLSVPEEVEKLFDERTKVGVMEDKMGSYTEFQSAQAIRDAAQNTSGGLASLGASLGAGSAIAGMFSEGLKSTNKEKVNKIVCKHCGEKINSKYKFCPICGKTQGDLCKKCGATNPSNAKFCSECGSKLAEVCKKCGAEIKNNSKFCSECGEKISDNN